MRILIPGILATLLAACSYGIYIDIKEKETGAPLFKLKENSFPIVGMKPSVRTIRIYYKTEDGNPSKENVFWEIECIDKCKIKKLKYGILPSGFREVVESKPLAMGKEYTINVDAWGSHGWLHFGM